MLKVRRVDEMAMKGSVRNVFVLASKAVATQERNSTLELIIVWIAWNLC